MNSLFYNKSTHRVFGIRIAAIFETWIFLTLCLLFIFLFVGDGRMQNTSLHPFWIIVLLTSVQYGTAEGIFAAALSTLFLYAGNIPAQRPDELYFDYELRLALLPTLWFITAFVLGELRMRIEWENRRLRHDFHHLNEQVEKITSEYELLKESYHNLEVYLSGQEETAATSFRIFKVLSSLEPAQIIFGVDSLIETSLHPLKFSVYAKGPQGLEAVTGAGWEASDSFCRRFVPSSLLYKSIVEEKKLLSAVSKEDLKILKNEGILAYGLTDPESGEVFGMVKIEDLDFRSLNISRIETFRIVCELIGRAFVNAKKHQRSKENSIYSPLSVYSYPLFCIASNYVYTLGEELSFKTACLSIQLLKGNTWAEENIAHLKGLMPPYVAYFAGFKPLKELKVLYPLNKPDARDRIDRLLSNWLHETCRLEAGDFTATHTPITYIPQESSEHKV